MKKLILIVILFVSVNIFSQETGRTAPSFSLENLNGEFVELKDFTSKGPVLISFWATWCKPCVEELSEYNKIFNEYKSKGVNVLAISIDNERTLSKVKPFVKANNYSFTVLLDPNSDVARKYYVQSVPYTFIVDKKGNIVYSHLGYKKGDEIKVKKILNELSGGK